MTVRAKFKVDSIEQTLAWEAGGNKTLYTVKMSPVQPKSDINPTTGKYERDEEHENSKFWRYSPAGNLYLGTVNEEAVKELVLGAEFYVDITRAP